LTDFDKLATKYDKIFQLQLTNVASRHTALQNVKYGCFDKIIVIERR